MIFSAAELDQLLHLVPKEQSLNWSTEILVETVPDSELLATLSAFGNMPEGGSVIFGLNEFDGTLIGVADPTAIENRVMKLAEQWIVPRLELQCYRATKNNKVFVIANVSGMADRLCRVIPTSTAYLRGVGGNHVLAPRDIQQLEALQHQMGVDRVPVDGTTQSNLDPRLIESVLRAVRDQSERFRRVDDEQALRMLGILEPSSDRLTVAGLYALGRYPQQFFPNLSLTASAVRAGDEASSVRQRFDGPVPEMLDNAVRWVVRNARRTETERQEEYRATHIPIVAIREIITNALVHRDLCSLARSRSVELVLTDDGLTVSNPGRLWNMSRDDVDSPRGQTAVHDSLYEILRLTPVSGGHRVITEAGGLREANQALRRAGMEPARLIDAGIACTVILGRRSTLTDAEQQWVRQLPQPTAFTESQQHLLASLMHGRRWTSDRIAVEFGPVAGPFIRAQLGGLVEKGLVESTEYREHSSYQLHGVWLRHAAEHFGRLYSFGPSLTHTGVEASDGSSAPAPARVTQPEDRAHRAAATSKHGEALWKALGNSPQDIHDLIEATGLSASQIRYAVQRLIVEGLVQRSGGQGHRKTTYQREAA